MNDPASGPNTQGKQESEVININSPEKFMKSLLTTKLTRISAW